MKFRLFTLFIVLLTQASVAAELPHSAPGDLGFSAEKLEQLNTHFQAYVDDGRLAGLTTLVARKGKVVHFEALGKPAFGANDALEKDAIFRIYSMTKPVTGVALMMLVEEGKISLDDPVSDYIPAFGDARVFKAEKEDGTVETVPARREITVLDLMRHTAGLTYGVFGTTPVDKIYQKSGLLKPGQTAEQWIGKLAEQPLLYQPGDAWVYSFAVDVQGYLIEKVSGQPLDVFFRTRIFEPLGMYDTGFYISEEQAERLVSLYQFKKDEGVVPSEDPYFPDFTKKPSLFSGGGGLVSTTADYWRFAQMLANDGALDGVRLLKPETVRLMASNLLPDNLKGIAGGEQGLGFGIDLAVVQDTSKQVAAHKGEYFWGGLANTLFWVDPTNDVVAILMTNVTPTGIYKLREEMRQIVNGALVH